MKKNLLLSSIIVLAVFLICSCGNKESQSKANESLKNTSNTAIQEDNVTNSSMAVPANSPIDNLDDSTEQAIQNETSTISSIDTEQLNQNGLDIGILYHKKDIITDEFIFDVTIPKIGESVPNAYKINDEITRDYSNNISVGRENYKDLEGADGFGYPTFDVHYEIYEFDGVYEIAIINYVYSTWGSGFRSDVKRYYYDTNIGNEISEDDFFNKIGITKESIQKTFATEKVENEEDALGFDFSDIQHWLVIDGKKRPRFYVNLYDQTFRELFDLQVPNCELNVKLECALDMQVLDT